ncbi:hypothetical protein RJ639_027725 [Escallonia herrerae]|uniref:N-acetyltransferase domain-containing protein n=1 Tax=Escallonia herrerae TaxID=1293975 RepID=A0AA88X4W2_9ASTE|nr:hypothetical protein RJ639_027725 [Escallonia herrerae]
MMPNWVIVELHRNSANWSQIVGDIVRLERKIFPKHESLARSYDDELSKKNSGLLYYEIDGCVAGYAMYSWPSSLCASITKLAGATWAPSSMSWLYVRGFLEIVVWRYKGEALASTVDAGVLKENYRRHGLGEALLKAAIDRCRTRNVHRVSLHVEPLRISALNLYKKLGFQVDNLIVGYYSSNRNAYRMYLDFTSD